MKPLLPLALALATVIALGPAAAQAPTRSPVPEPRPQADVTAPTAPRLPARALQTAPARPAALSASLAPVDSAEAMAAAVVAPLAEDVAARAASALLPAPDTPATAPIEDLWLAGLVAARTAPTAAAAEAAITVAVHGAQAATPRPNSRPDSEGEIVLASASTSGPAAVAGLAVMALRADTVRPVPRPLVQGTQVASVVPASAATAVSRLAVARSPLPQRRSETARRHYLDNLQRAAAVRTQPAPPAVTGQATGQLCGVRGIEGQTLAPIAGRIQGCGVASPVRVSAVDGVRLSQGAIMDCDTARALHRWVREGVKPAVGRTGGGAVELRVAAHYVCRTMNHRRNAPISEHGRGRAIDISGIRLADGTMITVLSDWRDRTHGPILRQMHRAACGIFTTTLGPGSDGMHEDHFHYDTAQRRSRPICR